MSSQIQATPPTYRFESSERPRYSPWGAICTATQEKPGIWFVTTASHGGYMLSQQRYDALPATIKAIAPYAAPLCYEEDADWALVVLAFGDEFDQQTYRDALATIRGAMSFQWMGIVQKAKLRAAYLTAGGVL
jgi:hypothetical protein